MLYVVLYVAIYHLMFTDVAKYENDAIDVYKDEVMSEIFSFYSSPASVCSLKKS